MPVNVLLQELMLNYIGEMVFRGVTLSDIIKSSRQLLCLMASCLSLVYSFTLTGVEELRNTTCYQVYKSKLGNDTKLDFTLPIGGLGCPTGSYYHCLPLTDDKQRNIQFCSDWMWIKPDDQCLKVERNEVEKDKKNYKEPSHTTVAGMGLTVSTENSPTPKGKIPWFVWIIIAFFVTTVAFILLSFILCRNKRRTNKPTNNAVNGELEERQDQRRYKTNSGRESSEESLTYEDAVDVMGTS